MLYKPKIDMAFNLFYFIETRKESFLSLSIGVDLSAGCGGGVIWSDK